jgi:hypothetical protein
MAWLMQYCKAKRRTEQNNQNEKKEGAHIMRNLTLIGKLTLGVTLLCGNAATAWAGEIAREDNSGLFVWIFLAFCALIIVAQLIPAAMMMLGFAKGANKSAPEAVPVMADRKTTVDG